MHCNGLKWNATLPNCTRPDVPPATRCIFDIGGFCGWTQSPNDKLDWTMINVLSSPINATAHTGMKINPFSSHYLHFESSGSLKDDSAAIFSPVYNAKLLHHACFSFEFGMNGANMGSLSLFIIPEGQDNLTQQLPLIIFQGNPPRCHLF